MPEIVTWLLVGLVGIIAGFFDATVGAGGLVSIPSLIFLGLPSQTAIATDRFGMHGEIFTALINFWKGKKILWKYVPILGVISVVGSLIGTKMLLQTNTDALERAVGILLLAILPLYLLRKDIGTKNFSASKAKKVIAYVLFFLIMVFGGFFGQGTGPLITFTLTYFLGFTMIEVIATSTVAWFFMAFPSLIVFVVNHKVDYGKGIVLLIGMAIGGYLGSHIALQKGERWIKHLFILLVVASAIKLIFF